MQLAITFALFKLLSPGFSPFYLYECWSDFLKRMGLTRIFSLVSGDILMASY